MTMTDDQIRLEDIRLDVLTQLYHRRRGAHSAETLRTVYLSNRDYSLEEVKTALADLERLHLVESAFEGIAGTQLVWRITADGLRLKERGRA